MGDNTLRGLVRTRLLDEMLGGIQAAGGTDWSVLIMDAVTTKVMSRACRISEILDYGISLVENLSKRREPLPTLSGVYFITPSETSLNELMADYKTKALYKTTHVFFSTRIDPRLLAAFRSQAPPALLSNLRTLKEVNVEILVCDKRSFITDEERALSALFGDANDASVPYRSELATMAGRLASAFAAMKEFPSIRFRARPPGDDATADGRLLAAQRLAVEVHERLTPLQRAGGLPATDTCDLIVLDRGFDPVAPVIHEWTYEAMAFDLLKDMDPKSNSFKYTAETGQGKETKDHILSEKDELWTNMRHKFIADVQRELSDMTTAFFSKNKAAKYKAAGGGSEQDMRSLRNLAQALPEYREQLSRLGLHSEMASQVGAMIRSNDLQDLGKLEQDLVYGEASTKDLLAYLQKRTDMSALDKIRLLICFVATHPEKMDDSKAMQWARLADLSDADMAAITSLESLGVPVRKKGTAPKSRIFSRKQQAKQTRKGREVAEGEYELQRFVPLLQELLEAQVSNSLKQDEFPYVNPPSDTGGNLGGKGVSVRGPRTKAGWTKSAAGGSGSMDGKELSTAARGKRLVVFVIGGITRSELRAAHLLSAKLGRDIILGSTSVDTPASFVERLRGLSSRTDHLALNMEYAGI